MNVLSVSAKWALKHRPMSKAKQKKPIKKTQTPTRTVKKPVYRSFRLSKRLRHSAAPLPKARHIFSASIRHLLAHKKFYLGMALVYLVITLVLVKGLGFGINSELTEIKDILDETFSEQSSLVTGAALFGFLLGSAGAATSEAASIYQTLLLIVISLALIWSLRQTHAKARPSIKDAFYKGMYPLIPFLLVLLVILLQFLPLAIGNLLYSIVISNGLAVTGLEQVVWGLLFSLTALLSLYMVTSSTFAMYIVTLPDVVPMQALRSARELVRYRRMSVARKLLFLPFVLLLLAIVIMLPILYFAIAVAEFVFFVLSILAIVVAHAYLYELYRKML